MEETGSIQETLQAIRKVIGEIPILAEEQRLLDEAEGHEQEKEMESTDAAAAVAGVGRPKVLADGTYATETAYTSTSTAKLDAVKAASKPPLRSKEAGGVKYYYTDPLSSFDPWGRLFHWSRTSVNSYKVGSPIRGEIQRYSRF